MIRVLLNQCTRIFIWYHEERGYN